MTREVNAASRSGTGCPADSLWTELIAGRLDPAQRAALHRHLDTCVLCRALVVQLARGATHPIGPGEHSSPAGLADAPGQPTPPGFSPLAPGMSCGRFVITGLVGIGGMGVVYTAYDPTLDRKVAIKLLRTDPLAAPAGTAGPSLSPTLLLEEARAMARIAHPNVLPVYETVELEGAISIVMELVRGHTLSHWLEARPRAWREVAAAFADAGAGLLAAHRAGLVHRDFKPDNVLIGEDGRVRVTDFGLAQLAKGGDGTRAGGTPRYMAPEQRRGDPTTDRADVYSFCLALQQALPPRAPRWLSALTRQGLTEDPAARPTMEVVHARLARGLRRQRRRLAAAVAALVVIIAVSSVIGTGLARPSPCVGLEGGLEGTWDAATKQKIGAAFAASQSPAAPAAALQVGRLLDDYARGWVGMRQDNCAATRIRQEQSERVQDLRSACLARRAGALRALTGVLASADATVVQHAVEAAANLPALDGCADLPALLAAIPPPSDPATAAEVSDLEERLDEIKALVDAGRYPDALPLAHEIAARSDATRFDSIRARAHLALAEVFQRTGRYQEARDTAYQAIWSAEASGDAALEARGWLKLVQLAAMQLRIKGTGIERALQHASALATRSADRRLQHVLEVIRGQVLSAQGQHAGAVEVFLQALPRAEELQGPDSLDVGILSHNLGLTLSKLGRLDEARKSYDRALAISSRLFGEHHPSTAVILHGLGSLLKRIGQDGEARALLTRAVAIHRENPGGEHYGLAAALLSLGLAEQAAKLYTEARARFLEAHRIFVAALGPENRHVASVLQSLGGLANDEGRPAESLKWHREALAIDLKASGEESPELGYDLLNIGEALLALGQAREAIAPLTRAAVLWGREPRDPEELANLRLALARALQRSGQDLPRARELARQALADLRSIDRAVELRAEIEAWLTRHAGPGERGEVLR